VHTLPINRWCLLSIWLLSVLWDNCTCLILTQIFTILFITHIVHWNIFISTLCVICEIACMHYESEIHLYLYSYKIQQRHGVKINGIWTLLLLYSHAMYTSLSILHCPSIQQLWVGDVVVYLVYWFYLVLVLWWNCWVLSWWWPHCTGSMGHCNVNFLLAGLVSTAVLWVSMYCYASKVDYFFRSLIG